MRPADIKVGSTYINRGAGKTRRIVVAIGPDHRPDCCGSDREPTGEDGVLYEQNGKSDSLYISSFVAWRGKLAD